MNAEHYEARKAQLRETAGFLKSRGMRNSKIGPHLDLTKEQFRDLFKPAIRYTRYRVPRATIKPKRMTKDRSSDLPFALLFRRVRMFQRRGDINAPYTYLDVIEKFGDDPVCYMTGLSIDYEDGKSYELDHFVPVSKGGTADLINMQICNPLVNRMKNGTPFYDFVKICGLIAERGGKYLK